MHCPFRSNFQGWSEEMSEQGSTSPSAQVISETSLSSQSLTLALIT